MYIRIWRSTYTKSTIKASRLSEFDKVLWLNFKTEFENYISQVFSLQTFVWSRSIWPANICLILTKNAGVWHKNLASGKIRRYDSSGLEPGIPTSGEVYPHQVRCTPSRLLWGAGASYDLTPATLPNDPACLAQLAFEFPSPVAQTLVAQLSFFISNQLSRLSLFQ